MDNGDTPGPMAHLPPDNPFAGQQLNEWYAIKQQIAVLSAQELDLRIKLLGTYFDAEFVAGSRTIKLPTQWRLKAQRPWSYKLTDENGETKFALSRFNPELANNLVRWKPDLSVTAYKSLSVDWQKVFDPALTIKPDSPQLTLIEPNAPEPTTLY